MLGCLAIAMQMCSSMPSVMQCWVPLIRTIELIATKGYRVGNVDCTICAERPKLNPHVEAMRKCLAPLMQVDEDAISIKATTSERMGFVGREEGIAAYCVALIEKD